MFPFYKFIMFGISMQYDCSSADINPIGSISKQDLRAFLRWAATHLGYSSLADIEAAPPTAELEPIRSNYSQVLLFHISHSSFPLKTASLGAFYSRVTSELLQIVSVLMFLHLSFQPMLFLMGVT